MKKIVFICLFLYSTLLIAQKNKSSFSQGFYVKFISPIEELDNFKNSLQNRFSIRFNMQELISKLTNSYIYKLDHNLIQEELLELDKLLNENKDVAYTSRYYQARPTPPPHDIFPVTPNFINHQGYLGEYPGLNISYAWSKGANGKGISIKNLETGLNLNHEEFDHRNVKIANNAIINSALYEAYYIYHYFEHGTATAGVVYADDGEYGITGIAYNAEEFILYPEWVEGEDWNRLKAVTNAINDANKGDVVIYEMQMYANQNDQDLVPAEYDPLIWDLTRAASDKGVIVVAAAGNGFVNLDDTKYIDYKNRGDSGAIIVGARYPDYGLFSTYGERINVHAWSLNVFTTGYGTYDFTNDFNQNYTDSYGGSSSATAIVAGSVAIIQSYYHELTNDFLSPVQMRNLLIDTGVPQPINETKHVGPQPDLKAVIEKIDELLLEQNRNNKNLIHLSFFPNPTNDILNIKQINIEPKQIIIYDVLGKLLLSDVIDKKINTFDLSNFSNGIYYVKVKYNSETLVKKIVKQ